MTTAGLSPRKAVVANAAFFFAVVMHNLTYPLSAAGGIWPAVFYIFYSTIFVAATWALSRSRILRLLIVLCGAAVLAAGLFNSYTPGRDAMLAVLLSSIAYHIVMCMVLAIYTFSAKTVMTDVLLAATSLYLVIGSCFAAVLTLVEWILPGSFVAGSGMEITWQRMVYFSYVTLTTLGYGDIIPVGFYAQSAASFEAVLGTLYTVILLSRLVGLHTSNPTKSHK
ncbi:MAG: ion channel [Rhizobiaceae bacterium]|nr:ion channel [Rhizobiaceae bacterium]